MCRVFQNVYFDYHEAQKWKLSCRANLPWRAGGLVSRKAKSPSVTIFRWTQCFPAGSPLHLRRRASLGDQPVNSQTLRHFCRRNVGAFQVLQTKCGLMGPRQLERWSVSHVSLQLSFACVRFTQPKGATPSYREVTLWKTIFL